MLTWKPSCNFFFSSPQTTVSSSQDSTSGSSLRRQQTYPPSSSQYRLQEAVSFTSAPSLYTYPSSAPRAMEQLLVHGSSPSVRSPAGPYAPGLIPKEPVNGVVHGLPAHYQQHFPSHPYVGPNTSTTRGSGTYSGYQISPGIVSQYPYIWDLLWKTPWGVVTTFSDFPLAVETAATITAITYLIELF